jgi:hypothetical protein
LLQNELETLNFLLSILKMFVHSNCANFSSSVSLTSDCGVKTRN